MNNTIKFWLDYAGGIDVVWLSLIALAGTQLFKMLIRSFGVEDPMAVRPVPYLIGAFAGLLMIDFSPRGALIGLGCGMLSSLMFFALLSWLERKDAPGWQVKISAWLSMRDAD